MKNKDNNTFSYTTDVQPKATNIRTEMMFMTLATSETRPESLLPMLVLRLNEFFKLNNLLFLYIFSKVKNF